jgi:hypothetical protein
MTEFPAGDAEETERVDEKRGKTPNRLATLSLKLGVLAFVGFFLFSFSALKLVEMLAFHAATGIGFALGWLSLAIFFLFSAVPAIILGHMALLKIWRRAVPMAGWHRAVAGLLLGYGYVFLIPLAADALGFWGESHCCSNESAGIVMLRTIAGCQTVYRFEHGVYAGSFAELNEADGMPFIVIDGLTGRGLDEDVPFSNFLFTLRSTDNGNGFEATASPYISTPPYVRYYFIDSSGLIRINIAEPADSTSPAVGEGKRIPWWRVWWRVRCRQRALSEQQP